MMDFLGKKDVFMKMNLSSKLGRDSLGLLTHIHPKAAWREDPPSVQGHKRPQAEYVYARHTYCIEDRGWKREKEKFVTLSFKNSTSNHLKD